MMLNDVKTIIDNLEDFIELPDGIERLRKAVLALAVSGKLVPQDIQDGDAADLYQEIQVERAKLEKGGLRKKKKEDTLSQLVGTNIPFEVPKTWKWTYLGDVCYIEMGQSPEGNDVTDEKNGLPFFQGKSEFGYLFPTPRKWCSKPKKKAEAGDILLSVRAPVGSTNIAMEKCGIGRGLAAIRPELTMTNIFWRMVLDHFTYVLIGKATGTTFQAIRGIDLTSLPVPLPPLAEQERIVVKAQQVMRLLDVLETKKQERDEVRKRLTRSAMHSLGLGDTKVALQNLQELVKTPNDVKELEKSILTLAVSGKLVPQNAADGQTNDFYNVIERPSTGRKKMSDTSFAQDVKPIPFDIPNTWKWVSLDDVCSFEYGFTDSAKETGDARFVRITDMGNDGCLVPYDKKFIQLNEESKKALLNVGDILVARIGATFGRTILFQEEYPAVFASYLIRISFDKKFLLPEYFWIFTRSNAYWDQALSLVSGSAIPQFNANLIKKILLPVPPPAEQLRIIGKVHEMMALIRLVQSALSS